MKRQGRRRSLRGLVLKTVVCGQEDGERKLE
jgi:hypothetical protein